MAKVNLNDVSKSCYNLLMTKNIVPNKDKVHMSFKEREEVSVKLEGLLQTVIKKLESKRKDNQDEEFNDDKNNVLLYMCANAICYIRNTDLNKYLSANIKENIE